MDYGNKFNGSKPSFSRKDPPVGGFAAPKRSGRNHQEQRFEKFREDVGSKILAERRAATEKKFFGKPLDDIELTSIPQDQCVPISSAGVGLAVQNVATRIYNSKPEILNTCSIFQLYRVMLGQFEMKLYENQKHSDGITKYRPDFKIVVLPSGIKDIIKATTQQLSFLCGIINQVGDFSYADVRFHVGLLNDGYGRTIDTVVLSNLRGLVEFLSDAGSPRGDRDHFASNNILPGSIWINDPNDGYLLTNADAIIPADYGESQLVHDFSCLSGALDQIARKIPELKVERIDYGSDGQPSQLLSYLGGDGPTIPIDGSVIYTTNTETDYHSHFKLDKIDILSGIVSQVGRMDPIRPDAYCRSAYSTVQMTTRRYLSVVRSLLEQ